MGAVDLLLRGDVVNVYTGEVEKGCVGIKDDRITCVGKQEVAAKKTLDAEGYILPGLIDAHLHVESSMLTPQRFAEAAVSRGTTCVVCDPHEVANVAGIRGIEYMMRDSGKAPLRFYYMIPSCVPATSLETTGGSIGVEEVKKLKGRAGVLGLAEVMNYPGVVKGEESVMEKLALCKGMVIDGHCPGLRGAELCRYVYAGIGSDHECRSSSEALEKLSLGMHIMIREGSASKDLHRVAQAVTLQNSRRFMLVSDDLSAEDLVKRGHVDYLLRRAVEEGIDPITALQMVTLNPAEYFGLRGLGSIAPGKKADIVVVRDLKEFRASLVLIDGRVVARDGEASYKAKAGRPLRSPMNYEVTQDKLAVRCSSSEATIRVIEVFDGQLYTKEVLLRMRAEEGILLPCPKEDLLKACVAERYHGTGNLGVGFVKGFGLGRGAIASSIAHDHHNVVAVGASDAEVAFAANALRGLGGGLVVVREEKVLASLALPVGGLMSLERAEEVASRLGEVNRAAASLGCSLSSPFSTLSFIALAVIPELKLTDLGLVDVASSKLVPLIQK
jgi:adenine deaminase